MRKSIGFLILVLGMVCCQFALAAEKAVLVLFPVSVDEADAALEDEFGSALQEGLQSRFKVFYGPAVEAELEKEYQKVDCSAESCQQNIAIAFNGELIADASVSKVDDGYILKLSIRNIISGEITESKTVPCKGCDAYKVIDQLKSMGLGGSELSTGKTKISIVNDGENSDSAIFIFDSIPTGADVFINGKPDGKTPYQGLDYKKGQVLDVVIKKDFYSPLSFVAELKGGTNYLEQPLELERGEGFLLVSFDPYKPGLTLQVDGVDKGKIPQRIALEAGDHEIRALFEKSTVAVKRISIGAGENQKLVLDANAKDSFAEAVKQYYWSGEKTMDVVEKLKSAVEVGHPYASVELARLYTLGEIVAVDRQLGKQYFDSGIEGLKAAVEKGDAHATYLYGEVFEKGINMESDTGEAKEWYEKSAELGYAPAQFKLGFMHQGGVKLGIIRVVDPYKAVELYTKAANQGHAAAQFHLGYMYSRGDGVKKNPPAAVELYRKAASQGHPGAQRMLKQLNIAW